MSDIDIDAELDAVDGEEEGEEYELLPELPITEEAQAWLSTLFGYLGLEGEVRVRESEDMLEASLEGPGAEVLLAEMSARGPEILQAIQLLAQSAVSSGNRRRYGVSLDPGGFRQNRVEQLREVSRFLGEKATAIGAPITVLGMSSFDRRAVHTGLREMRNVRTESEGFGPFRRLKIQPR